MSYAAFFEQTPNIIWMQARGAANDQSDAVLVCYLSQPLNRNVKNFRHIFKPQELLGYGHIS